MQEFSISLAEYIKELSLDAAYLPCPPDDVMLTRSEAIRAGLALSGYFDVFDANRVHVIGYAESSYLESFSEEERLRKTDAFLAHRPVVLVIANDMVVPEEMIKIAKKYDVPILHSKNSTSDFIAASIAYLSVQLAPRITRHGVLVEVYGEGVLILGDSGVGKSETAIELVKRGHRLVADDAVEIKRVSAKSLVGSAPEIIRHYVELRGIGIVDVRRLFGMGSVKLTEKIDLVVTLEPWVQGKMYDRLGMENETMDILGIKVPALTIPVRPGRNLAVVLEIAAMNNRQKKMGYNTAEEFNKRLMSQYGMEETDKNR